MWVYSFGFEIDALMCVGNVRIDEGYIVWP